MARQPKPWRRAGGPWYSQLDGEKVWLADKAATKREAQEELYRLLADRGKVVRRPRGSLTAKQAIDLYLGHCRAQVGRDERTKVCYDNYRWFLFSATKSFGRLLCSSLRPHHAMAWIDSHETWGKESRKGAIRTVKSCFAWARRAGHIPANPLAEMKGLAGQVRQDVPTAGQAEGRLATMPAGPLNDLVFALTETGCRPKEIATLTADRVDMEQGIWHVVNKTRGATGEDTRKIFLTGRMVELSRRLVAANPEGLIFRGCQGQAWNHYSIAKAFRRLAKKLGMKGEGCAYAIRHYYATQALVNGVPVATVATLLGHKSTNMVMRVYSKLNREGDHLREAAEQARRPPPSDAAPSPPPPSDR